ncbi:hypothetical protein EDD11_002832 [Mortierella claussenii]|nr:hypothetical protein EDD11_002832 [Mortierella claussenii]
MAHLKQEPAIPATGSSSTIMIDDSSDAKKAISRSVMQEVKDFRNALRPLMLYIVSMAQFLDIVNGASVSVAIIPIAEDLKFSVALLPWILNAYTIAFAGLLLFSGRMGDLFGHRSIFMFGLFWFATWALIVSFSTSPIMFVISRALQGVGAASTVPTAMALIATNYPAGPERTKAFSIFAAFGGLGAVVGVLMAGGLIASIGWEWIFRVSSIAAYVMFIMAYFVVPVTPRRAGAARPRVDFLGSVTAVLGVTGIIYYITMGNEDGWSSAKTLPILIAGVLLLVAFVYIESKVEYPIMPFRIWKSRQFTTSLVLAFILMAMIQGLIFYANMIFQEVYQYSAIQTALRFLVHALLAIVVFTILGRLIPRLALKPLILSGLLLRCVSALMFAFVTEKTSYWALPFPALIIHVFGVGFTMLPVQITAVRDAANQDQGLVGAIYNTGLQLGGPFGIAIFNVISISTNGQQGGGEGGGSDVRGGPHLMKGYKNALFGVVAFGIFGFILGAITLPWTKPQRPAPPQTAGSKAPEALEQDKVDDDDDVEGDNEATVSTEGEKKASQNAADLEIMEASALDVDLAVIPSSRSKNAEQIWD